jgi:hypothetical protein
VKLAPGVSSAGAQSLPRAAKLLIWGVGRRLPRWWGGSAGGGDPRAECRCGAPDFGDRVGDLGVGERLDGSGDSDDGGQGGVSGAHGRR